MPKSRKHRSQKRSLVKTVGKDVSKVGSKTANVASKGISGIYNFISSGFNLASKDTKKVLSTRRKSRKSRKSRRH